MITCENCGAPFCPDSAKPHDAPLRFCTRTCRMTAKKRRNRASASLRRSNGKPAAVNVCELKTPYPAAAMAERMVRLRGGIGSVYSCGDHWHITRRPLNAPNNWRDAYQKVP